MQATASLLASSPRGAIARLAGGLKAGHVYRREDLARFEYRLRPYRHWVTFENVSLQPGQKTDVKISTETIAASNPADRVDDDNAAADTEYACKKARGRARAGGVGLRWRPFSLRTLLIEQENSPFIGKPAKLRYMSNGAVGAPLVLRTTMGVGANLGPHLLDEGRTRRLDRDARQHRHHARAQPPRRLSAPGLPGPPAGSSLTTAPP